MNKETTKAVRRTYWKHFTYAAIASILVNGAALYALARIVEY